MTNDNGNAVYDDEISLQELVLSAVRFYRELGRPLVRFSLLLAILVAIAVAFKPEYEAYALLDTPGLTLEQWHTIVPSLSDRTLIEQFFKDYGKNYGGAISERLGGGFSHPEFWLAATTFETALKATDKRKDPSADPSRTSTLGLEITLRARDSQSGQAQLMAVGQYIRETALWSDLRDYLLNLEQTTAVKRIGIESTIVSEHIKIIQLKKRIEEMKNLIARYPQAQKLDANTIMSVQGGGNKYLPPIAQLVALETDVFDANAAIQEADRELAELNWTKKYVNLVAGSQTKIKSGSRLYKFLMSNLDQVFAGDKAQTPEARMAYTDVASNLIQLRQTTERYIYKTAPTVSDNRISSSNPIIMGPVTFIVVLLLSSMFMSAYRKIRLLMAEDADGTWSAATDPLFGRLPPWLRNLFFGFG